MPPSDRARAAALYERFTGHDARVLARIELPAIPRVLAVIGECDGILYSTVRDGRSESYIHEFAHRDKPLMCVSPDGRQIILVGDRFVFTDRGIVDASDTRNLPASVRKMLSGRRIR